MVVAVGHPSDLRAGHGSVRDAWSAISNRPTGPPPVVQNRTVVERYLRLLLTKLKPGFFGSMAVWTSRP